MDDRIVPLEPGTLAPNFRLRRTLHATVSLHRLHGHPVVLVFYPMDWEPVSREQLTLYERFSPEFRRFGARLLGISVDHALCHEAFARDAGIHFPLLSDFCPKGSASRLYGVYREREEVSARALFVLDVQGAIRFSSAYLDLLNPGVDGILTSLETLAMQGIDSPQRAITQVGAEPKRTQ